MVAQVTKHRQIALHDVELRKVGLGGTSFELSSSHRRTSHPPRSNRVFLVVTGHIYLCMDFPVPVKVCHLW